MFKQAGEKAQAGADYVAEKASEVNYTNMTIKHLHQLVWHDMAPLNLMISQFSTWIV